MEAPSLTRLLARGDLVAVEQGRLTLTPASGRPVPTDWLASHQTGLVAQAASIAKVIALEYMGYSVGRYGPVRAGGVTLQFRCLTTGQELFAIFNAGAKRTRTTRHGHKGDPLPPGQFRVGKRSAFYRFWQSTGLPFHRMSDFHDYMGKLRGLIFTGTPSKGERLDVATLRPLTISWDTVRAATKPNLPDNSPTISRQHPDNTPTSHPDKEGPKRQQPCGIQPNPTAGESNHGNKVIREYGYTGNPISPQDQSIDEWLTDYENVG